MASRPRRGGFGKRRAVTINRNSRPKPISEDRRRGLGSMLRDVGARALERSNSKELTGAEGGSGQQGGGHLLPTTLLANLSSSPKSGSGSSLSSANRSPNTSGSSLMKVVRAARKLTKHFSEGGVWRDEESKVYDGNEGRDQYWSMFKTGKKMDFGRRHKKDDRENGGGGRRHGGDGGGEDGQPPLSPRSAYLKKMEEFNLRPERIQFDKEKTVLSIQNYGLGDQRMEAFAQSLSHFPYETVNISSNRITDKGFKHVCQNLSDGCFTLDVSGNDIGPTGVDHLVHYILKPPPSHPARHELVTLSLASCKIGDAGAINLAEGVKGNQHLKRLLLSNNDIEEEACMELCKGLMACKHLEELDISWNNIDLAAAALIKNLKKLVWLDISSNSLGSQTATEQGEGFLATEQAADGSGGSMAMISRIATALAENETLLHVSLSNNKFDSKQLNVLARLIENNQTMIGIHLSHPSAYIDAHGFLRVSGARGITSADAEGDAADAAGGAFAPSHHVHDATMPSGNIDTGQKLMSKDWTSLPPVRERRDHIKYKSCWICGGYTERTFKIVVQNNDPSKLAQRAKRYGMYLHLSIDGFVGEVMDAVKDGSEDTETYQLSRMVPPGKLYVFFSVAEDEPKAPEVESKDDDNGAARSPRATKLPKRGYTFLTSDKERVKPWTQWTHKATLLAVGISENGAPGGGVPKQMNMFIIAKHSDPVNPSKCLPRVINGASGQKRLKKTWSLGASIFSKRAQEADGHSYYTAEGFVRRVLRTDWRFTKLSRWLPQRFKRSKISNQQIFDDVQAALVPHAAAMMQLFKFVCAIGGAGHDDIFTVTKKPLMLALQAFGMGTKREIKCRKIHTIKAKPVSKGDFDTMFTVVNLELTVDAANDDMGSMSLDAMNDDNPDNAFTRFEWLEFIVRLAVKRFPCVAHHSDDPVLTELTERPDMDAVKSRLLEKVTVADACGLLIEEMIEHSAAHPQMSMLLDPEELHNCDWFRVKYLYLEKTDKVFKWCRSELTKLYNKMSGCEANDGAIFGPNMSADEFMDTWVNHSTELLQPNSMKSPRALAAEAAAALGAEDGGGPPEETANRLTVMHFRTEYLFCKMLSLTCYQTDRNENVTFTDFLEALARMALRMYPPEKIDRPFSVSIARLMHFNLRDFEAEKGQVGGLSRRAKRFLDVHDVPPDQRVLTTMDLLED